MTYLFPQLEPRVLSAEDFPGKTIALDITKSIKDRHASGKPDAVITPMHIMAYTQRAWRINPDNARDTELILAVYNSSQDHRLIVGAFIFGRQDSPYGPDCFAKSPYDGDKKAKVDPADPDKDSDRRYIFLAEPAPLEIWNRYVGHYLPPRRQGEANPVRYYIQD